jgi:predicted DNA binding CopG/RHH family protein
MQPATNPEDIHTILSRFSHWAGKQKGNGNGNHRRPTNLGPGAREIPYEEAVRLIRSRKAGGIASAVSSPAQPAAAILAQPAQKPAVRQCSARPKAPPQQKAAAQRGAGKAAKQKAAPQAAKKMRPKRRATPSAARTEDFRQALTKSLSETSARVRPVRFKDKGRDQRVSVRLSRAEERLLQQCAARAGVTMSEYLRMHALETAAEPTDANRRAAGLPGNAKPAAEPAPAAASRTKSVFGDWMLLLRHRFLASPARFAERA